MGKVVTVKIQSSEDKQIVTPKFLSRKEKKELEEYIQKTEPEFWEEILKIREEHKNKEIRK